jgi:hypothetical protein
MVRSIVKAMEVGLASIWQPGERTALSLSGGPQLNTLACGRQQGFPTALPSVRGCQASRKYIYYRLVSPPLPLWGLGYGRKVYLVATSIK